MQHRKIAFIGAGNVVSAIVSGLVHSGYPADLITVCAPSPERRETLTKRFNVKNSSDNVSSAQSADVIVLGIKPNVIVPVCTELKQQVDLTGKLILTVVTGVTLEHYQLLLGDNIDIVRAMPNTPSAIGKGMTGLYAPERVTGAEREVAEELMATTGKVHWLDSENDINKLVAISGSAPAYFYLFMEAIQKEAQQLGFDVQTTRMLIEQTALGAVEMVINNPNLSISTLREQVTSKGGTTAQAIQVFKDKDLENIVAQAMRAASDQAEEMEARLNIK